MFYNVVFCNSSVEIYGEICKYIVRVLISFFFALFFISMMFLFFEQNNEFKFFKHMDHVGWDWGCFHPHKWTLQQYFNYLPITWSIQNAHANSKSSHAVEMEYKNKRENNNSNMLISNIWCNHHFKSTDCFSRPSWIWFLWIGSFWWI